MDNNIVITTISEKTIAVSNFENINGWNIIIVGDIKTPDITSSTFLNFISYEIQQKNLEFSICKILPINHYSRKNIGYLYALKNNSKIIYETDDDNIPYNDWNVLPFSCNLQLKHISKYINVYKYFTSLNIWPRGLPLEDINTNLLKTCDVDYHNIGVWQGLADKDPDVDAIYRLTNNNKCVFDKKLPIFLNQNKYCPFNSQNTTWNIDIFPLMYLPCTVSFRFTDILRGYIAQRIMWEYDYHVGFHEATVYQERNEHNLMEDFVDEIVCYTRIKELVNILEDLSLGNTLEEDLLIVYKALEDNKFTTDKELPILHEWLQDIRNIKNAKN